MKTRQLAVLAGVLAALTAAYGLARYTSGRTEAPASLLAGKAAELAKLSISSGGAKTVVARKGDGWVMLEPFAYPADGVVINELLAKLGDAKLSAPLSSNPAKRSMFEVDASSGIRVTAYGADGKTSMDVYVGKAGTRFDSVFVRREGSDDVSEALGLPRYELEKKTQDFLEKNLIQVNSDAIEWVELKSASGTIRAEQGPKGWRLVQPKLDVSSDIVKAVLEPVLVGLVRLDADQLVAAAEAPPAKALGLEKPYLRVSVKRKGRDETVLTAGAISDPGRRYVKKDGEDRMLYILSNWRLTPFIRSPADFKKKKTS